MKHRAFPVPAAAAAALVFAAAFLLGPGAQYWFADAMPGDIGDARLNNYFLENIYLFLAGRSDSLWHLGFFAPFPYVLGFSDNLFGAAPLYLFARVSGAPPDTAFQVWFLLGYAANFAAAYYALNKLGCSRVASAAGALIFAFALPVAGHVGHAQLHYRFGVPLSAAMLVMFFEKRNWGYLLLCLTWLVWQFYCSIYIGYFTSLMLIAMTVVSLAGLAPTKGLRTAARDLGADWRGRTPAARTGLLLGATVALALPALLFFPYIRVSRLYDAKRTYEEIATMLPRPVSYFVSDGSWLWAWLSKSLGDLPMKHEHQMFVGALPLTLAAIGVAVGWRNRHWAALAGSLAMLVGLTLSIGGQSLWRPVAALPLASAIRAMTRIDMVLLFPVAFLAGVALDRMRARWPGKAQRITAVLLVLMVIEFSATSPNSSSKGEWRQRVALLDARFPERLPTDPIVFFAQETPPWQAAELDAMWVALDHGVLTMNGYSGMSPPGFELVGYDCSEVPHRVLAFLRLSGRSGDEQAYRDLMQRIVPVGFEDCDEHWKTSPPPITYSDGTYTAEAFRKLSLRVLGRVERAGRWDVRVRIENAGEHAISARSASGRAVRISWRFRNADGTPAGGWDTRKDLPFDIPAQGALDVTIGIDPAMEISGSILEVSIVQELVFWGHDIGIVPATLAWE